MTQDPWTWTTRPPQTVQDLVQQLGVEFDGRVPLQNTGEVILRLSSNGAVSLPVLTFMARQQLERLAQAGELTRGVGGSVRDRGPAVAQGKMGPAGSVSAPMS